MGQGNGVAESKTGWQSGWGQGNSATDSPTAWQSMSEHRKALEGTGASTSSTPTRARLASLTPVPIPGVVTPRKATPFRAQSVTPSRAQSVPPPFYPPPGSTPSTGAQPLKGILKTPEREQHSGGQRHRATGGQNKSKNKRLLPRAPKLSWSGDTKRGPGSY